MKNFISELENHLSDCKWNNLISNDLVLYGRKIITKYKDQMLTQRQQILQDYANSTSNPDDLYYIYNTSSKAKDSYNLCLCNKGNSPVITKTTNELPEGSTLGSILRKQGESFKLDLEATRFVGAKINQMIQEQIRKQDKYLEKRRIEGHLYEVSEKYSGRISLYDITDVSVSQEELEEIDFPADLYESAKEGDLFLFKNGTYQKHN